MFLQLSLKICSWTILIAAFFASIWWKKHKNRSSNKSECSDNPPVKWQRVGEVTSLTVFPLKSAKGTYLQKARFSSLGLVNIENPHFQLSDREFIVYDCEKKTAISGLVKPNIVLMSVLPVDVTSVKFSFPGQSDFHLTLPVDRSQVVMLNRWWGETVLTVDCGEAIARWVSQCLLNVPTGLRMGHYSKPTVPLRTVDNGWTKFLKVYPKLRSHYLGAYSYMASYHLITEESIAELNSHLSHPISQEQFRANVTVKGAEDFAEDLWDWIKLGDQVVLRNFKPCTRCAVIAINPDTGKLDPNLEPLSTLKKFRQLRTPEEKELSGSEPMFGLYLGMHTSGIVSVGDPVYIGVQ